MSLRSSLRDKALIHNIVFDLGNVLLDFKPVAYLGNKYGNTDISQRIYREVFCSKEWVELDRGTLTAEEAIAAFISRNPDISSYIEETMSNWDEILIPIKGTIDILKELRSSDSYKLYLLSNFHVAAFLRVSEQYDFFKLFDGMVVSSNLKLLKPDPEIYKHLLGTYGLVPAETIFIDDVKDNTEAAQLLGIDAILFTTPEDLRKQLELKGIL